MSGSATASSAMSSAAGVLLHLVDGTCEHAGKAYKLVRKEIEAYGAGLADKPEIVALAKVDALDPETRKEQMARLKRAAKKTPLALSATSGRASNRPLVALLAVVDESRAAEPKPEEPEDDVPMETGWRP